MLGACIGYWCSWKHVANSDMMWFSIKLCVAAAALRLLLLL
jgi:hypothetical protein